MNAFTILITVIVKGMAFEMKVKIDGHARARNPIGDIGCILKHQEHADHTQFGPMKASEGIDVMNVLKKDVVRSEHFDAVAYERHGHHEMLTSSWSANHSFVAVPKEGDVCQDHVGIAHQFCSSVFGTKAKAHMEHYIALRRNCTWFAFAGEFTSQVSVGSRRVRFSGISAYQKYMPAGMSASFCKITSTDRTWQNMHIFRLGPFHSDGDPEKWYRWGMDNLMPEYNGMQIGITSYLQAAVDAHGKILGYPPLQIHHNHFSDFQCDEVKKGFGFTRLAEELPKAQHTYMDGGFYLMADTHTDKQCMQAMGGTDCLIRVHPPGFAIATNFETAGCVFADYIDVRPANSSRLKWWSEFMVSVTRSLKKPLHMDIVGTSGCGKVGQST